MFQDRRSFLKITASTAAAATLGLSPRRLFAEDVNQPPRKLRILILGGTVFLGPAVVKHALARGHQITLFNRGKSRPHMFEDLEQLRGDRNGDLESLKGRDWDVVLDTSANVPRLVRDSATLLAPRIQHYIYISSVSVYASNAEPNIDEDAPVGTLEDPTVEQITGATYGPLKALCEKAAEEIMPGRVTNIRPGLIVGPLDPTDRFTYWPVRIDRGGEVLTPGTGDDPVQIIDVDDLGRWIVHVAEKRIFGVFNALGPDGGMPMRRMLEACQKVSDNDSQLVWVNHKFLEEQGVSAWSHMPAWVPPVGDYAGFGRRSCTRAMKAGLTFRPIEDTCRDTLAWFKTLPEERQQNLRAGLKPEREQEVLAAWKMRSNGQ
jgi:2'-hydroxyisoflavone reductase